MRLGKRSPLPHFPWWWLWWKWWWQGRLRWWQLWYVLTTWHSEQVETWKPGSQTGQDWGRIVNIIILSIIDPHHHYYGLKDRQVKWQPGLEELQIPDLVLFAERVVLLDPANQTTHPGVRLLNGDHGNCKAKVLKQIVSLFKRTSSGPFLKSLHVSTSFFPTMQDSEVWNTVSFRIFRCASIS